jgi:hypothetical protein
MSCLDYMERLIKLLLTDVILYITLYVMVLDMFMEFCEFF